MPVLTVYRHGGKGGVAPRANGHQRAKRNACAGWSVGATRRNTQFLYSIRENQLHGAGFAVTLTLKDCPPTSADFHALRRRFEWRLRRLGLIRMHWVIEWQRRGVPHLHAAVWFPPEVLDRWGSSFFSSAVASAWLLAGAMDYGANPAGQHCSPIHGVMGWCQYVSKHAARGISHYQRSAENVPEAWQSKTGRVWGRVGDWPEGAQVRVEVGRTAWFVYRRMVRSWRIADARQEGNAKRISFARKMLRCHDRNLSEVRGFSEWIPHNTSLRFLGQLERLGFDIWEA